MIASIRYVDMSCAVNGYTGRVIKLTIRISSAAPACEIGSTRIERLNPMSSSLNYIDITGAIECNSTRIVKPDNTACTVQDGEVLSIRIKCLQSVVQSFCYIDVAIGIYGYTIGET
ncbi:hypothetical protein D3C81_1354860 [compost metagenome]